MNIVSATITGSLILNGVNISSVTGSESSINALNSFTASAATTGSNQFNGNQTVTGSVNITGSLIVTGSIIGTVTTASYVLNAVSASYALVATTSSYALVATSASYALNATTSSFALNATSASFATNSDLLDGRDSLTFANTGSNNFVGTQNINGAVAITGSLTTTGAITAQTLNVQQVTSSIVYSSGSNIFGNSISNTQSMTGSVGISGSLSVNGSTNLTGVLDVQLSGQSTPVKITQLSDNTLYGAITFNNNTTTAGYVGMFGGGTTQRLFFNVPTGGDFNMRVNNTNVLFFNSAGIQVTGTASLTGALSGTSATFSQGISADVGSATSSIQVRNASTDAPFIGFYRGGTLRNTLQLLTDGSFKLTDASLVANAGLTMGALSGTSATFSGALTAVNISNNGIYYGRANASFPATSLGYFALKTNNLDGERGGLTVQVSNSTSTFIDALTLNYTGAATFSSSVTAGGQTSVLYAGYDSGVEGLRLGADTSYYNAIAGTFSSAAASNKMTFVVNSGNGTRGTVMTLLGSGNVGIGTTSPGSFLEMSKSSNSGSGGTFPRLAIKNTLATQGDGSSTFNFADILVSSGNETVNMFLATTYAAGTWAPAAIINVSTNHALQIKTNNTLALTIASTGAATFSSSVTAAGATFSGTTAVASAAGTSQMRIDRSGTVARIQNYDTGQAANISLAYDGGNVGIGTTSPGANLDVLNTATDSGIIGKFQRNIDAIAEYAYITAGAANHKAYLGALLGASDVAYLSAVSDPSTGNGIFVKEDGKIGIGTTAPAYQLQLSTDSAAKPSTNTWTISSDSRLKENITPYTKGLSAIMAINPVNYDYNGKAGFTAIKNNIGVIAQDVLEILPESISTYKAKLEENDAEDTELYNFNSHALTYILINAIKELKAEIDLLKGEPIVPTDNNLE